MPYLAGLSSKGAKVMLLSFEKKDYLSDARRVDETRRFMEANGIKWLGLRYHKRPTVPATAFDIMNGLTKAFFIAKKGRVSVIHARSYIPALIALILRRFLKVKYIFDMRGLWADERVDGNIWPRNGLLYKFAKRCEKSLILNADKITVLTNRVKDEIQGFDYLKDRKLDIEVIPTCVDLDLFRVREKDDELSEQMGLKGRFVFVYTGSIGTWYMLDKMIDFFKTAKQIIKNARFLFLTQYGRLVDERMRAKEVCRDDYCVKSLFYDEVPRYLSLADASIFFIKPSYSKKSSCPTKLAESLACGLPALINSGIGDTDDIITARKVGVCINDFSEDDYNAAAEGILHLLSDSGIKDRCRRAAEEYFSLREGVERYWRVYREAVHK
jgi:glycosyltransferase involved in cell wall biosynthesis